MNISKGNIFAFFAGAILVVLLWLKCCDGNTSHPDAVVIGKKKYQPVKLIRGNVIRDTVLIPIERLVKTAPKIIHDTIYQTATGEPKPAAAVEDKYQDSTLILTISDVVGNREILSRNIAYTVKEKTITNTVHDTLLLKEITRKKRFSVGVSAGYGYAFGTPVPQPIVGVTVSYKLFDF